MLSCEDALPQRPRRVLVAGVSGAGKTTLALRISDIIAIPHTEIDALFHGPQWTPRPEFLDDVRALVATDAWVTEWQYDSARPLLAEHADLLVWLDLPFLRVTLPRVIRRTLRRAIRREQLWNGNIEAPLRTFFTDREHVVKWAISTRKKYHTEIPALVQKHPELVIVRLRSTRQVERWLKGALSNSIRLVQNGSTDSERNSMNSESNLPPIERWWPELSISAKHALQEDLHGEISATVLEEIGTLAGSTVPAAPQHLNDDERAYIATQTEIVD
ncbi:hypothetical protein [Salinibacterium sp. NK8237]|uniref:hypothetical protein n=1 Tax=Salinibacterium sp. NK8237 TaxID=2792038 RepID=UPI0027DBCD54|nr:hypothetical protein [Salinibacterium sp. NK8237]